MRDLDKRILVQLIKDCQQPVSKIAEKVGVTRQTVAKEIKQLKDSGMINSFTVKLNPEKFGLRTKAYILMREDPRSEFRKRNEEILKRIHQVSGFYRLFGEHDAILEVQVKNSEELTELVKRIHKLKGVRETDTLIVHSTVKDKSEDPVEGLLEEY
ncbi:MAG TPA: Lrp/AsnC family transcriptional regulator [archaeon]|nr:Lrp/AsnC family transcriptional regulator [archaeon]